MHMYPCVHPPRVESLFPSVLWSSFTQPYCLQSQMLWGFLLQIQTLRLGNLTWGSELSLMLGNLCDAIIFQCVGHPLSGYGICSYCLFPSHFGFFFVFGYRLSFLVGSSLFCQWLFRSCDFGVFMKGGWAKSFYSAILFRNLP